MAIAIDSSTPALASGSTTATTASFTAPAGSLLVALAAYGGGSGTNSVSDTGGLTWTVRRNRQIGEDVGAFANSATIFTAVAATSTSRTVTATTTNGGSPVRLKVLVITGADTSNPVGASGEGSSTTANLTVTAYTSTEDNSRGVGIAADDDADSTVTTSDVGFAWFTFGQSAGIAVHKATDTATSGSSVSLNFNGTGATRTWNWVAAEILADASPQTIVASGIASAEAFGTAQLNLKVTGSGIASAEAFGTLIISTPEPQSIQASGIASDEAFGTLTTGLYVGPSGIASSEAFGDARLSAVIGPTGIASAEAFGTTNVAIEQFVSPSSIATAEAFGTPVLQLGYPQTIICTGIRSAELVDDGLTVRNVSRLVLVNPSIQETPAAWDRLHIRFGIHRGITLIKSGGTWSQVRYPSQTEMETAERVFMGGHRHTLTVAEATELTSAGFGAYITLELDT